MKLVATTSQRLKEIMLDKNIRQIDLAHGCKMPKGTISNYVKGRRIPKQDALKTLSNYLNVNPVWLIGYDVNKEAQSIQIREKINSNLDKMNDKELNDVNEYCNFITSKEKK